MTLIQTTGNLIHRKRDGTVIELSPLREPAPPLLFSLEGIDLNHVAVDSAEIQKVNKHRGEAQQIDYLCWLGEGFRQAVGIHKVRDNEWWHDGHIPGYPIMPAVMMIEAAAQVTSYLFDSREVVDHKFVGFTRIDDTKFRNKVVPGDTLVILATELKFHVRRFICRVQGLVGDKITFESTITGMPIM